MSKSVKDEVKEENKKDAKVTSKLTEGYLISKANYIIPVSINNKQSFIQPFGKLKVIKEQIQIDSNDARYLTFVKNR